MQQPRRTLSALPLAVCMAFALSACGQGEDTDTDAPRTRGVGQAEPLPSPEAARGSVTGMPGAGEPGEAGIVLDGAPARAAPAASPSPDYVPEDPAAAAAAAAVAVPAPLPAVLPAAPAPAPAAAEPGSDAAIQVLRNYFARLNAGDTSAARRLWREGSAPSQLLAEDVVGISAQLGRASAIDAGAGQRHVQVPVTVQQTLADGQIRMASGSATLHASVVDGAAPGWYIAALDLRR